MFRNVKYELASKSCIRGALCVGEKEIKPIGEAIPVSNKNCRSKDTLESIRHLW